jgi:hypothetical protein
LRKDATMARLGLVVLLCAAPFLCSTHLSADPPREADDAMQGYLIVQIAPLQAEAYLMQRQPARAVEVLEAPLSKVSVNRKYLAVLRNAYRAYITELTLKGQTDLAKKYEARLRILDNHGLPESAQAPAAAPLTATATASPAAPAPVPAALASGVGAGPRGPASPPAGSGPLVARGKVLEADPFGLDMRAGRPAAAPAPALPSAATRLRDQAEEEFARKRYAAAWKLYEEAHRADRTATQGCQERWAYCKLHRVVEQINTDTPGCNWGELEREVHQAMSMAPKLEKAGKNLLGEIDSRRGAARPALAMAPAESAVKHLPRNAQGWEVVETPHFRVLYKQSREFADRAARVAEQTCLAMHRKWFGHDGEPWSPKCDVYLHATAADYGSYTGQRTDSPGFAHIDQDPVAGRVAGRAIHLHCENPAEVLSAVLPHEATHVVLAGQFGRGQLPRWADEGMAVLTEPAEKLEQHRYNLARCRAQLFAVNELMQLPDWPASKRISAFYAQSVSLVSYLCGLRDARTFTQFLRDGLREGYEPALRRHYGIQGFADLQGRWGEHVAADQRGGPGAHTAGHGP